MEVQTTTKHMKSSLKLHQQNYQEQKLHNYSTQLFRLEYEIIALICTPEMNYVLKPFVLIATFKIFSFIKFMKEILQSKLSVQIRVFLIKSGVSFYFYLLSVNISNIDFSFQNFQKFYLCSFSCHFLFLGVTLWIFFTFIAWCRKLNLRRDQSR